MAQEDETVQPADEGPVERRVRPQAWSPALTYPNYEQQRVWGNGEPRPEDVAYWKAQGLGVTLAYTADDVRYMLEGAWCAGYYDAGYTHDSAYAEKMAEKCADEFLGPNARLTAPDTALQEQR